MHRLVKISHGLVFQLVLTGHCMKGGWWVQENEAWRVGVSVDIGCVSMHWEAWVWAGNAIGSGRKMMVVGRLDGRW